MQCWRARKLHDPTSGGTHVQKAEARRLDGCARLVDGVGGDAGLGGVLPDGALIGGQVHAKDPALGTSADGLIVDTSGVQAAAGCSAAGARLMPLESDLPAPSLPPSLVVRHIAVVPCRRQSCVFGRACGR